MVKYLVWESLILHHENNQWLADEIGNKELTQRARKDTKSDLVKSWYQRWWPEQTKRKQATAPNEDQKA
ncbi:MAG: hypothetical protein WCH99_19625 [Verrucomicrobiota bacterium]